MEGWKYLATSLVVIAGLVGVFFAKDGKLNTVRGLGWVAVALILVAGGVSGYQTYRDARDREIAAQEAAAASAKLRRIQAALVAGVLLGSDLSRPVGDLNFMLEVPMSGDAADDDYGPAVLPDFIGPFPKLPAGGKAVLVLGIGDDVGYEATLTPGPGGALRLDDRDTEGTDYLVTSGTDSAVFTPGPKVTGEQEDVRRAWLSEAHGSEPLNYILGLTSNGQLRGLLDRLSDMPAFGRLTVSLPGVPADQKKRVIQVLETRITPMFVIYTGSPEPARGDEPGGAPAEPCVTRVWAPAEFRRKTSFVGEDPPGRDEIVFDINASPQGFRPEVCDYVP